MSKSVRAVGATSKALGPNPKDLFGNKKVSFTKVPATAMAHCATAMMDGADKYGQYNWRDRAVIASIYVDAGIRHFLNWFEGQVFAKDSGVHHLGHSMACGAILIDAEANGVLIDDRPVCGDPDILDRLLDQLAENIAARRARYAAEKAAKEKAACLLNRKEKRRRGSSRSGSLRRKASPSRRSSPKTKRATRKAA